MRKCLISVNVALPLPFSLPFSPPPFICERACLCVFGGVDLLFLFFCCVYSRALHARTHVWHHKQKAAKLTLGPFPCKSSVTSQLVFGHLSSIGDQRRDKMGSANPVLTRTSILFISLASFQTGNMWLTRPRAALLVNDANYRRRQPDDADD